MRPGPAILLLALIPYAGCAGQPPEKATSVSSARGAVRTVVPSGRTVAYTFRLEKPAGEGVAILDDRGIGLKVYASRTALEDRLGDDPTRRSVYTFQHILASVSGMDRFSLGKGCTQESIRPFEGGGYYGDLVTFRCAGALGAEVRAVAVNARRTVVVYATARSADPVNARQVASTALRHLEVDRDVLPRRVQPGGVVLTD